MVETKAAHLDSLESKEGFCLAVPATARPQLLLQMAAEASHGSPKTALRTEEVLMLCIASDKERRGFVENRFDDV